MINRFIQTCYRLFYFVTALSYRQRSCFYLQIWHWNIIKFTASSDHSPFFSIRINWSSSDCHTGSGCEASRCCSWCTPGRIIAAVLFYFYFRDIPAQTYNGRNRHITEKAIAINLQSHIIPFISIRSIYSFTRAAQTPASIPSCTLALVLSALLYKIEFPTTTNAEFVPSCPPRYGIAWPVETYPSLPSAVFA